MLKKALACGTILCFMTGHVAFSNALGADLGKGKTLYTSKCMLCHGPEGKGDGPGAIALNPKPADFTSKSFWQTPNIDGKISAAVKNGKGQMVALPDLSSDDIQSIILYLNQAFKPK